MPGFHRTFDEWVKTQPEGRHPRRPNLQGLEVKPIAGQAGDLLIWHRLLLAFAVDPFNEVLTLKNRPSGTPL